MSQLSEKKLLSLTVSFSFSVYHASILKSTPTQNQGQVAHLKWNGNQGEGKEFVQVIHFLRSWGQYLMGILICINFKLKKTICCVGPGNIQPSLHNCGGKKNMLVINQSSNNRCNWIVYRIKVTPFLLLLTYVKSCNAIQIKTATLFKFKLLFLEEFLVFPLSAQICKMLSCSQTVTLWIHRKDLFNVYQM